MEHLRGAYAKSQKNKITKETIKSNTYHLKAATMKNNMEALEYNKIYEQNRQNKGEDKINLNQLLDDLKNL